MRLAAILPAMCICGAVIATMGCSSMERQVSNVEVALSVPRASKAVVIDGKWDKPAWQQVTPIVLTQYMGQRPEHFPRTRAKVQYDDEAVYLIFQVNDRYVRAVTEKHQGPVCKDSCVEFFFSPSGNIADGYMNIEMNCGGTMLVHFQKVTHRDKVVIEEGDLARIQVASTLPRIVEPERTEPTTWCVEYRVPFDIIAKYCPNARQPASGVTWRANFYKCGDDTSHPHWLTWAVVQNPQPNFHLPEYFATMRFQ